jgi:hypothetical protein
MVVVRRDRDHLRVRNRHLRLKHRQLEVLLVLLRSKVTPREHQDQRIPTLEFAELANRVGVIRQLIIRKDATGNNVSPHTSPANLMAPV